MCKKGSFDKYPCTWKCDKPRWSKESESRVFGVMQDVAEKAACPQVGKTVVSAARLERELGKTEDTRALRSDADKTREATKVPPSPSPPLAHSVHTDSFLH
jgi:hypothetical protein